MVNRFLQERNLGLLVKNDAFEFTETFFPYTSGEIGPYRVNALKVTRNGSDYKIAIDSMRSVFGCDAIFQRFDVISGGESKDWDFSNPLAYNREFPHAKLYKDGRVEGAGADLNGKRVLHVADVNNQGSSLKNLWIPIVRNAGGEIKGVLFYVDRMERGVQVMRDLGLSNIAVVPLDQNAWNYLRNNRVIDQDTHHNIRERMEDQDAWALKMLRSEKGFKRLVDLLWSQETNGKATKVVYSSGIADELQDRLRKEYNRGLSSKETITALAKVCLKT